MRPLAHRSGESSATAGGRRRPRILVAALVLTVALAAGIAPVGAQSPLLEPIDEQKWTIHSEQTWADYVKVRPDAWESPLTSQGSDVQYKGAVILLDFGDQPFLITQPAGSHIFGNPQPGHQPVAREDVDDWMLQFLNFPNEYNKGQGIHAYWMEDSHGKIGVDLQVFGPYRLTGKYHEYGGLSSTYCPAGDNCNRNFTNEGTALWTAAVGPDVVDDFDFRFLVTAGHDETSTWHEFGEMMFETREDIPASFGPPGAENGPVLNSAGNPIPNWSTTRYVPWTSWAAASNHWPSAGGGVSRQAENSGIAVYAHEFSHIRGLPDNYGNPYDNSGRMPTAHWEMMSRGSFNGPDGGVHSRWQVPNAGGSSLGPHHMIRFKQMLGILEPEDQVLLQRDDLKNQGVAVTTLKAREYVPNGDKVALQVSFGSTGDLAGTCAQQGFTGPNGEYPQGAGWCPGTNFNHYTMEVVDRVGNDSFTPGHGVLIAKTKNTGSPRVWAIDANTENINRIDFYRPESGEPVPMTRFDPRQLNDGTFHAGTNSGSKFEWIDTPNRLQFYVLEKLRDEEGTLHYDLGVRSLDGAGAFARSVAVGSPSKTSWRPEDLASCSFPLTNTGSAGADLFASDVFRLSATSSSGDWEVVLPNALAAAEAGETVQVPVHVKRNAGSGGTSVVLTARSESDPTKAASAVCEVSAADVAPAHRRVTVNGSAVLGASSAGTHAGDEGSLLYSDVDVRQTPEGLKGTADFTFDSGGKTYRLSGDVLESLGVGRDAANDRACRGQAPVPAQPLWCSGIAEFELTASLYDESKSSSELVASDLSLHVTVTDRRTPTGVDTIAVTARDGDRVVFSSSWAGFASSEQPLAGGSVRVG